MRKTATSPAPRPKKAGAFDFKAALARVADEPDSTFARILFAAETLFADRGYAAVGIRDIAAAVPINVSTLHFHWKNKAVLYEAICRYQADLISRTLAASLEGEPITPARIDAAVQDIIRLLAEYPAIAPMVLKSASDQEFPELAGVKRFDTHLFDGLAQRLRGVAAKGSLAREFPDLTFLTLYHAVVLLFADSAPQKALLGASLYKDKKLQDRIGKFASRLVDQLTCD